MNNLYAVLLLLATVQGIAEFLPISSSGHLVILEQFPLISSSLLQLSVQGNLFLNVALHVATLVAVVIYLRGDIARLAAGFFRSAFRRDFGSPEMKATLFILVASIPAGILGLALHDIFERVFSTATVAFSLLIVNGFILLGTKRIPLKSRQIEETGFGRSLVIGLFQAIAILPGISRSGMTITGGMLCGLKPEEAAKFSFLMAIPVIAGAGLVEGLQVYHNGIDAGSLLPVMIAMGITCCVALVALGVLMRMVRELRLYVFGYYTIAIGVIGLALRFL